MKCFTHTNNNKYLDHKQAILESLKMNTGVVVYYILVNVI